jgi:hypothetical protein
VYSVFSAVESLFYSIETDKPCNPFPEQSVWRDVREAQDLLEQARPGLNGKPLKHVNKAIHQLSLALRNR